MPQFRGLTRTSLQSSTLASSSTSLSSAASAPVRRRTSLNRLVDMVRTRDRAQSLTTVVIISTFFVFITLTITFVVATVCCKRNAVFALNPHRHRRRGSGRHSSKSTYSPGSGSRDCEHCEMDQWRYSATAIAESSDDDGQELDSPIFDDFFNSRRPTCPVRRDADELAVRWSRSPAISTLSLSDWNITGSRITLLSHASSSSGGNGSINDVTPSPTSEFRCLRTPEVGIPSADYVSSDNEDEGAVTLPLERKGKLKRKWKRDGASNPLNRQQPYHQLDDN